MTVEIKHRFTGAVLFTAELGSLKLTVEAAVEASADLGGADLGDANLRGADLGGANLGGAYLRGADLIDAGQDSRGYRFVGWLREGVVQILAGCRNFTMAKAREHWSAAHANNLALRAECLARLDLIEAVATARGWMAQEQVEGA